MNEHKPGTLPYLAKKWEPLTGGARRGDGLTGHAAEICAWSMEQESRFLRAGDNADNVGDGLRYVFPIIRRAVDVLTVDSTILNAEISPEVVREITIEATSDVFNASSDLSSLPGDVQEKHQAIRDSGFIDDLAVRLHDSIVSFPG